MGPFLSGHNPRLVREGGLGWGESALQGEETPGPAGGSRKGNGIRGQREVGGVSRNPLPRTVPAITSPTGRGGGREALGPR